MVLRPGAWGTPELLIRRRAQPAFHSFCIRPGPARVAAPGVLSRAIATDVFHRLSSPCFEIVRRFTEAGISMPDRPTCCAPRALSSVGRRPPSAQAPLAAWLLSLVAVGVVAHKAEGRRVGAQSQPSSWSGRCSAPRSSPAAPHQRPPSGRRRASRRGRRERRRSRRPKRWSSTGPPFFVWQLASSQRTRRARPRRQSCLAVGWTAK